MELRDGYKYSSLKRMMWIYQDAENPKQWMTDVMNWRTGCISTMKISKRKANQLLSFVSNGWVEETQEDIDKRLAAYIGAKKGRKKQCITT